MGVCVCVCVVNKTSIFLSIRGRWSVCGSDGQMYGSECLMKAEACQRQVDITAQPLESCGGQSAVPFCTRETNGKSALRPATCRDACSDACISEMRQV